MSKALSRPSDLQQQQQALWAAVERGEQQGLAALAASRAAPSQPTQVAALLRLVRQPGGSSLNALPALALLARWARQQSLQPAAARHAALLLEAVTAAELLMGGGSGPKHEQARLTVASLLLLCNAAAAAAAEAAVGAATQAAGEALLDGRLGSPTPASAADALAAVAVLLPCLLDKPVAACWLLTAVLQWLGSPALDGPAWMAAERLAPAYGMMRGAALAALGRSPPSAAVAGLLRPAFSVLKTAMAACQDAPLQQHSHAQAAAAVLVAGGMAEALLRAAAGHASAAQLAAELEAVLVQACEAAGAAETTAAGLMLLRDCCALAASQLAAAVRRPPLLRAPAVARCQAGCLFFSALCLGPLAAAAAAGQPAPEASQLVRSQAACALVQHSGSMAGALSAQYAEVDGGTQRWLLEQVAEAARQVHQQYRLYSMAPPLSWLAAVDAAAVRLLLDRLFLSCLALLAAALRAAPAPPAQRAELAAVAAGTLADLQFCRPGSPPQYVTLLRAVLADLPGNPAAAAALAARLPCYAELAAPCASRGGQASWLVDGAAAARTQFLMGLLAPCCPTLGQNCLEERLAPLALLHLLHPHQPTALAAHTLLGAVLAVLPEGRRPPLAALYVERCLEGCPAHTAVPELAQALATAMAALPVGSPVALLSLQRLLDKYGAVAASGDPRAAELAAVVAQQLLSVDFALLEGAMAAVDAAALAHTRQPGACSPPGRTPGLSAAPLASQVLRREVVAAVRRTDDCVRKPALAAWLMRGGGGGGGGGGGLG